VPIVVGVDGSHESKQALRWALSEARLRRTPVHAVWVWHLPVELGPSIGPILPQVYEPDDPDRDAELRRRIEQQLDAVVAEVARELPEAADVHIEQSVVVGHAADMLVEAASGQELLVVGSRGRGGFAGLLLGSVSQACAHHAPCPVVIVRAAETDDGSSALR
jgi:nucleotide-binding universal stress UspA family protein